MQEIINAAQLAYLSLDPDKNKRLIQQMLEVMQLIKQLQQVDTSNTEPLFHPLDIHQHLREDVIQEADQRHELAQLAPLFENNLYLVPKIIDVD